MIEEITYLLYLMKTSLKTETLSQMSRCLVIPDSKMAPAGILDYYMSSGSLGLRKHRQKSVSETFPVFTNLP